MATQLSQAFYRVNALTQEQRDAAYKVARKRIAGDEPQKGNQPERNAFNNHAVSRFPKSTTRTVTALSIAALVAAFLPSAMRLNAVALTTNQEIMGHATSVYVAALATVTMAEIGQIIFSLAAVVVASNVTTQRKINWQSLMLYFGAFVCTLIALSGNGVSMGNHAFENVFAFLETFAPPVLVLIMAQILKTQMLHATEQKYAADNAYRLACEKWETDFASASSAWLTAYTNANTYQSWDVELANALRDALRRANAQSKAVLRELTPVDWRALVVRERKSEEWWQEAERMEREELERVALEEQRLRDEEQQLMQEAEERRLRRIESMRNGTQSTAATGEVSSAETLRNGDAFIKVCPECGTQFEGETLRQATNRLVAHMKRHRNEERAEAPVMHSIEETVELAFASNGHSNGSHA